MVTLAFSCYDWADWSADRRAIDTIFYEILFLIEAIEVYILMTFELTDFQLIAVVLQDG